MLFFYRILINLILLLSPIIILFRIIKKKEHPTRFLEKLGISSKNRMQGKVIWFHGSSVGEVLSIMPLIERLEKNSKIKQIVITSSTLSSSKVLEKYKLNKTIHQFFPIDANLIIKKFLNYWKPTAVFFVESEIWPNTIQNLHKRNIKIALLNARITNKTFTKWFKFKSFSKDIFNKFDLCLCQNKETKLYLKKLGSKNIKNLGNLKFSESKKIKKINKIKNFKLLNNKNILFGGISTHYDEEIFCGKVHLELKNKYKKFISIIIPRHVNRAESIKNDLENLKLKVHLHSSKINIENDTDIYLVDTYGETKSFLNMCKVVYLGGSIIKRGGQNPLEAARSGCKVIHGSNVDNFKEIYALLNNIGVSSKINGVKDAKIKIIKNLKTNVKQKKNIVKINQLGRKILNSINLEIRNLI
jgi:3-deoxy-D-manno-octulosonic-acid transferase|tara:strand:+ start:2355 stop:3599 length:1245 start_codon:yes stop_codon:yes gene_type:complete